MMSAALDCGCGEIVVFFCYRGQGVESAMEPRGVGYSFVACFSHFTIDKASLSRRSTWVGHEINYKCWSYELADD